LKLSIRDEVSMKNRKIAILAALLLTVPTAGASNITDRFSLRIGPGGLLPVGGQFTDSVKLSKVVRIGFGLNVGLRYKVNDYFYLDAGYTFDWMGVKKAYQPTEYKVEGQTPALHLSMIALNGTFFLSTGYALAPYVTVGAGMCPWRFTQKAFRGETWPAPSKPENSFASTDFGLNGGLGVETYLVSRFMIFAELKYSYIFARHTAKFGTNDFTQQDFLGLSIGLVYHFGRK
jgi:opacity protein-like surface antigen